MNNRVCRLFVAILVAATVLLTIIRIDRLAMTEPRFDQAFFAWWVRNIAQASHFLPSTQPGVSWLERLEGDTDSGLHQIVRNFYNKSATLFTSVPLLTSWADAEIAGFSYQRHTVLSIFAAGFVALIVGLLPFWHPGARTGSSRSSLFATGAVAFAFTALLPSLDRIAPLGAHNFGMAGLLVGMAATARFLDGSTAIPGKVGWLWIAVGHLSAFYTHWTNLFLLPLATMAMLILASMPARQKMGLILAYGTGVLALILPVAPFLWMETTRPIAGSETSAVGLIRVVFEPTHGALLQNVGARFVQWFKDGAELFSAPGLALGLFGLTVLAAREKLRLPLALIGAHIAVFCAMSGFAGASLRTYPYILPLLALGVGYALVTVLEAVRAQTRNPASVIGGLGAVALTTVHLASTIPALVDANAAERRLPKLWDFYYREQGLMRPQMEELRAALPENAVLLTWGSNIHYLLPILAPANARLPIMPSPIYGLWARAQKDELSRHLRLRGQSVPPDAAIFLAVNRDEANPVVEATLLAGLADVLGPKGYGLPGVPSLSFVRAWPMSIPTFENPTLYRVEMR